jgi:predicted glycosyl hydrolase (DUF1957 family)
MINVGGEMHTSDTIKEWIETSYVAGVKMREDQIRLALQPRPRWLPEWAWRKVIARLLVIEERVAANG